MSEANADQSAFWNAQPGQNWVSFQATLDAQMSEVTEALLAAAAPRPGERVIDIGCGAGGSTLALAAAVGPSGRVTGLDVSSPLLARAEERRRERGLANLAFIEADAQDHPFDPAASDLAVSRFGVMFFADPVAAFANIARALRPGGRLVFAAWAGPEHNPWFTLPQQAAVARLGPVAPAPPEAPGPMAFRDAARVTGLLAAAGLREARAQPVDLGLPNPGGLDALMELICNIGALPRILRDKGGTPEDRAAILGVVRDRFAPFATPDGGIRLPARVILFSAQAGA
jgi:SAM-dependent methyltransferase